MYYLGISPHLWVPVASALGFAPTRVWFKDAVPRMVVQGLLASHPGAVVSPSGARRPPPSGRGVPVFTDVESLPPFDSRFWREASTVFVVFSAAPIACPAGWILRDIQLAHCYVGGATDCTWIVSVLGVSDSLLCLEVPVSTPPPRPWSVISHSIDFRAQGGFVCCPNGRHQSGILRRSLWPPAGRGMGLFPTSRPYVHVVVPPPLYSSSWVCRTATPKELGDLWNVPLLLQDWYLSKGSVESLRSFVGSCPAKILLVGATTLLTSFYSGGVLLGHGLEIGVHPQGP